MLDLCLCKQTKTIITRVNILDTHTHTHSTIPISKRKKKVAKCCSTQQVPFHFVCWPAMATQGVVAMVAGTMPPPSSTTFQKARTHGAGRPKPAKPPGRWLESAPLVQSPKKRAEILGCCCLVGEKGHVAIDVELPGRSRNHYY